MATILLPALNSDNRCSVLVCKRSSVCCVDIEYIFSLLCVDVYGCAFSTTVYGAHRAKRVRRFVCINQRTGL